VTKHISWLVERVPAQFLTRSGVPPGRTYGHPPVACHLHMQCDCTDAVVVIDRGHHPHVHLATARKQP
jgi:hypothetical protein